MRLAWFSPWPPQPSGIAGRSFELVRALAARGFGIDVFVDHRHPALASPSPDEPASSGSIRVQSAHEFVWRAHRGQFDLVVYQLGNSRLHSYIWPYLFRWPGLAILHDARLHHARGHAHLSGFIPRPGAYRTEFAFNQPGTSRDAAELAIAGFDGPYYYLWPMVRAVVAASKVVGVHTRGGADELAAASPGASIEYVALGEGSAAPVDDTRRARTRASLGVPDAATLFGLFGALTADKRVPQVLRAFARTRRRHPDVRLLLAGNPDRHLDARAIAEELGLTGCVHFLPGLDDQEFDAAIEAVDVSLNLRWPTAVETSGPWLRALAASRPTVIIDLAHQSHVPALDPRDWRPSGGTSSARPVTVAIDILDEEHSLGLAMDRLAADESLRTTLGASGRRFWETEHTLERMVDDYLRVMARAADTAAPESVHTLPFDLRPDPTEHARRIVAPFGELSCELF